MEHNPAGRRKYAQLGWSGAVRTGLVLAAGLAGGLWFWPTDGQVSKAFLPAAIFAAGAALGMAWYGQARRRQLHKAAVDAFAEREVRAHHRRNLLAKQILAQRGGRVQRKESADSRD